MNSLLLRENYETAFGRLLKKALVISVCFHFAVIAATIVKSRMDREKVRYTPVYTVNLVGALKKPNGNNKKNAAAVKKKKTEQVKKKTERKKDKKITPPKDSLKYADKIHKDKDGEPLIKDEKTEEALKDTIAKIRGQLEDEEKLQETLKKISDKVKDDDPEEDARKKTEMAGGYDDKGALGEFGVISRDSMNLNDKKYYNEIWKRIKDAWVLPSDISRDNEDLVTVIVISIGKDGRVVKIDIEESSGIDYYDQSAIRAIKKAEPFPGFADDMKRDLFKVGLRFRPAER